MLYVGRALGLTPHRNAVGVVALGIDGPFEVANDPERPGLGYRTCRSVLIPPDTMHHLRASGRMAFLYVDPCSRDLVAVRAGAKNPTSRAYFDLLRERDLIERVIELENDRPWSEVRPEVAALLSDQSAPDPRVRLGLDLLHADVGERISLSRLAAATGLSNSRFRHLFRQATGVTVRRYRVWIAMGAAVRAMSEGETLTTAAHSAGFSSSAHLSSAFREMFGMEPSRLTRESFAMDGGARERGPPP